MAGDTVIRHGKATIQLTGFTAFFRRLDKLDEDIEGVAKSVFGAAVKRVYARSQAEIPVDEGNAKASGRMSKPRVSKRAVVTASVSYGGAPLQRLAPNEPDFYVIAMHGDPSHPGYKFLERPATAIKQLVMKQLANKIKAKLAKGAR